MNKSKLIEVLQNETGLTKTKTADVVDLFFGEMTKALAKGSEIDDNVRAIIDAIIKSSEHQFGRYLEKFRD